MNMAEQLDAIREILSSTELCAETMVSEIESIVYDTENE